MKDRKLIDNQYSPVRVRTVLGGCARLYYHAEDVCDVLGLAKDAIDGAEKTYDIKCGGELITVLDLRDVTALAHRSPLPYARDVLDWMVNLAKAPISKALAGMEAKIMAVVEDAGQVGCTRNAITRKTQSIDARTRNKLLADMVESELISVGILPNTELVIFRAVKYTQEATV